MNTEDIGILADPYTDSQSLAPLACGQASTVWPCAVNTSSAFSDTAPVAPLMPLMTFWTMVGVAQRNSPVSRSTV